MVFRSAIATLQEVAIKLPRVPGCCLGPLIVPKSYSWFSRTPEGGAQQSLIHGMAHTGWNTASKHAIKIPTPHWFSYQFLGCLWSNRPMSSLGVVSPAPPKLNDMVVVENLQSLPSEDIALVWKRYFENKPAEVPIALHVDEWRTMRQRMHANKMAVIPVHKTTVPGQVSGKCFVSMVCQAQMPKNVLITALASFQQSGAEARPNVVVTFYDDMVQSKHIVLGRADIVDGGLISKPEAGQLLHELVLCYTNDMLYQQISLLNQSSLKFDFDVFMEDLLHLRK